MLQQLENVYIPPDQIDNTPSRRDGIDAETEARLRIYGCELIQESDPKLQWQQRKSSFTDFIIVVRLDNIPPKSSRWLQYFLLQN
jgi:hypothetical protein